MSTEPQSAGSGGFLSPDGYWWWDGSNWVPAAQRPTPPPLPPFAPPAPARPRRPLPWLRIFAGSIAVVGAIATVVASIVPYGTFPDPSGGPTTTSSIFNGGFSGAAWDIAEPVFAVFAGVVAATLVFIGINRAVQAVSAGVLIAVGAQTATMWAAYFGLAGTDGTPEAGAVIGVGGAVLMLVGGLLALAAMYAVRPAPEPAAPAHVTATTTPALPEPAAVTAPVALPPATATEPAPTDEPAPSGEPAS